MPFPAQAADMHVHSHFSVDSQATIEAMCRAAIDLGLKALCFAEHMDLNPNDEGYGFFRYQAYSQAIDEARERFADRLTILKGVEFGEPHLYPREVERMNGQDLDVILAGIHWIDDRFVGDLALHQAYGARQDPRRLFERYYQDMLRAVRHGGFDVLAHLDLPKRYLGHGCEEIPLIDEVLREVVRAGMALEINTSPLRKGVNACAPDAPLLRRYASVGGRRLTLGSDAHAPNEIATGFERAMELALTAGPGDVGIYRRRCFIRLDAEESLV
ncbi:MAG: histidinol-phosphatase HisJ family protein [Chloroflexi bacterium]|nr:histidinol-phosphatase HisJ family protein [Chloroflexota bacterium]